MSMRLRLAASVMVVMAFSFCWGGAAATMKGGGEDRVANLATAVGNPIVIRDCAGFGALLSPHASAPGAVRWLGGLRFSGWARMAANRWSIFSSTASG